MSSPAVPRPNFVLIMTDTQATNVVGTYGHPELRTPNIDRLAETGTKFERAYTTCPLCTPARAGLFTGIYPHTSGAWTNNLPLGNNIKTMGQRFADAGYTTAYVGKWHLDGHDYFGTGQCPPGWDPGYWFDGRNYLDELAGEGDGLITLWRQGLNNLEDLRAHDIRPDFTWAHRNGDRAIEFLKRQGEASRARLPFLLVVSYDEPHHPFTCPPSYVERFIDYEYLLGPAAFDRLEQKPSHQQEWASSSGGAGRAALEGTVRSPMYLGCNSFVDAEIGRVIDAVHWYVPEDTWIIFTSDHGEMLGAHHLTGKGPVMYEEIAHIPLIIECPKVSRASSCGGPRSVKTLASHIDLLPTMMDLAGMDIPPILEGSSLVPVLAGDEDPDRGVVVTFQRYEIEHDSWGGFQPVRAIVKGQHKLVLNLLHSDELYDLASDPGEVYNLMDDLGTASVRDELHDRLLNWMYEKRDPFRGPAWERRPWCDRRRLQWRGEFRPRPADGYAPEVRDYDTGLPTKGVKTEYGRKDD